MKQARPTCQIPAQPSSHFIQRQLALECRDVNTSDLELLTPSSRR